jgi:hypothetical protein
MTLLLGHSNSIKGIPFVKGYRDKRELMITEVERWAAAKACMKSLDESRHTEQNQADFAACQLGKGTIPKDAGRFVILTTPQSVERQVLQPLTIKEIVPTPASGPGSRPKQVQRVSVLGARFARAIRDECHEEKGEKGGLTVAVLKGLNSPAIWLLSGTPFETSPGDIAAYIGVLETDKWEEHPTLRYCTSEQIWNLGRQFSKKANKHDAQLGPLIQKFKLILTTLGFIRRTVDTRWFGASIIELPPDKKVDMDCPVPGEYLDTIRPMDSDLLSELDRIQVAKQEARKAGKEHRGKLSQAGLRKLIQLRILTSFPGLVDLAPQIGGLDKLPYSWKDLVEWCKAETGCAIAKNLAMVTSRSSKFKHLCDMVREGLTDINGRPEKLLVMTKHPVTVYILQLVSSYSLS